MTGLLRVRAAPPAELDSVLLGSRRASRAQLGALAELSPIQIRAEVIGEAPITTREGACAPQTQAVALPASSLPN
jgi:hypothetical protein